MAFWILYGRLHLGEWPPRRIVGPYDDEEGAREAYRPYRGLPAQLAVAETKPERPDQITGAEVIDPGEET